MVASHDVVDQEGHHLDVAAVNCSVVRYLVTRVFQTLRLIKKHGMVSFVVLGFGVTNISKVLFLLGKVLLQFVDKRLNSGPPQRTVLLFDRLADFIRHVKQTAVGRVDFLDPNLKCRRPFKLDHDRGPRFIVCSVPPHPVP